MGFLNRKNEMRRRRRLRIRKSVSGTAERPRLSVYRSLHHLYAQLIDDASARTLAAASTRSKELQSEHLQGNKVGAKRVAELLAQKASAAGIRRVAFDRNGYLYHGTLQALAEALREKGLSL